VTRLPKPFDNPCVIQVVRNSGTIRLAEEEAIKRARDFVQKARRSNQGSSLDQVLKTAVSLEDLEMGTGSPEAMDTSDDD
jgi:ribonuclease P/MRP protein subunit POP5